MVLFDVTHDFRDQNTLGGKEAELREHQQRTMPAFPFATTHTRELRLATYTMKARSQPAEPRPAALPQLHALGYQTSVKSLPLAKRKHGVFRLSWSAIYFFDSTKFQDDFRRRNYTKGKWNKASVGSSLEIRTFVCSFVEIFFQKSYVTVG